MSTHSKVIAQTDTQTDTTKTLPLITALKCCVVINDILLLLLSAYIRWVSEQREENTKLMAKHWWSRQLSTHTNTFSLHFDGVVWHSAGFPLFSSDKIVGFFHDIFSIYFAKIFKYNFPLSNAVSTDLGFLHLLSHCTAGGVFGTLVKLRWEKFS